jgi:hypothetical protein
VKSSCNEIAEQPTLHIMRNFKRGIHPLPIHDAVNVASASQLVLVTFTDGAQEKGHRTAEKDRNDVAPGFASLGNSPRSPFEESPRTPTFVEPERDDAERHVLLVIGRVGLANLVVSCLFVAGRAGYCPRKRACVEKGFIVLSILCSVSSPFPGALRSDEGGPHFS